MNEDNIILFVFYSVDVKPSNILINDIGEIVRVFSLVVAQLYHVTQLIVFVFFLPPPLLTSSVSTGSRLCWGLQNNF